MPVVEIDDYLDQREAREALAELRVERAELVTWIQQSDTDAFYFTKWALLQFSQDVLNHSELYSQKWLDLARDFLSSE
jgi:hypothetical protein